MCEIQAAWVDTAPDEGHEMRVEDVHRTRYI